MNSKHREAGVAAVERALAVLGAFRDGDVSLTLHELSQRTRLYKSTLLRLIASLSRRGCIVRLQDGSYQLGPMLVRWGSLYLTSVRVETHVTPVLQRLAAETGESATFYTRQGQARLCLARVDCTRSVRDHVKVGDILPLDRGAGGKVLVAFDSSVRSKSVRAPSSMIIVTMRERDSEGAGMAAPVFGSGGELRGAISLSGLAMHFSEAAQPKLARSLLAGAADLTLRLGGDPAALNAALGDTGRRRGMPTLSSSSAE
jgi:DNA-binding IclR family transcriptional regulator